MRNLKRALSLAMATVMTLGMMTVGASAKGLEDFSDAAEIVNADAVAVTSAIGIFAGYDDGEFKGDNVVTRAEMAVICCKMLYGADVNATQFAEISTFTDVPAWAEGYVNLAASLGIIAGRGNGIFDPNSTVTTAEAAMMLTKTLGYFKSQKDFGDDWMLAATAKATQIGLYGDLKLAAKDGLTRDNVAELVFNALTEAVPVQYNDLLGVYYNENQGIVYALEYNYLETLGYKNFNLVYLTDEVTTYGRPATTWGFGKFTGDPDSDMNNDGTLPRTHVRMLSSDEIVTIADAADYVYTGSVKNKDLYKTVGKTVASSAYTWNKIVNGHETATVAPVSGDSTTYGNTGRGVITELYIDSTEGFESVDVVYINQFLGEVTKVKVDDDGKEFVTIDVLSDNVKLTLDDKTFYAEGYEKGDMVVFTVDEDADGDTYIAELYAPEVASGVVTAVEKDNTQIAGQNQEAVTYIELDGTKYSYNVVNAFNVEEDNETKDPSLNANYELYLDDNGYVVGYKAVEDVSGNYLYVKDADQYLSGWQAKVVFADGTAAVVDLKSQLKGDKDLNKTSDFATKAAAEAYIEGWVCSYSINSKGAYTLKKIADLNTNANTVTVDGAVAAAAGDSANLDPDVATFGWSNWEGATTVRDGYKTVANKSAWINTKLADENTVFVDVTNEVIYTGFENVPDYIDANIIAVDTDEDNTIDLVFIVKYEEKSNAESIFYYIADPDSYKTFKISDTEYVERTVYIDGEKTSLIIEADEDALNNSMCLYEIIAVDDDGYVTGVKAYNNLMNNTYLVTNKGKGTFTSNQTTALDTTVAINTSYWMYNDETIFVVVDVADEKATIGNANDILTTKDYAKLDVGEEFTYVAVVEADKNLAEVVYIMQVAKGHKTLDTYGGSVAEEATVTMGVTGLAAEDVDTNLDELQKSTLVPGDYVEVSIALDKIMKKASISETVNGATYKVIINGQECFGTVRKNVLVVKYQLTAADVADVKAGTKLALNVADIQTVDGTFTSEIKIVVGKNSSTDAVNPYYQLSADTASFTAAYEQSYNKKTGVTTIVAELVAPAGQIMGDNDVTVTLPTGFEFVGKHNADYTVAPNKVVVTFSMQEVPADTAAGM